MFERIGRKLIRGAKAEALAIREEGCSKLIEAGLKIGILVLALMCGGGAAKKQASSGTVIVNNYIYKEETHGH